MPGRALSICISGTALLLALSACGDAAARSGTAAERDGEVVSDTAALYARLLAEPQNVPLTEERYRQWRAATRALDTLPLAGVTPPRLTGTTTQLVERGAASLGADPAARRAIEAEGMSVREYVATTVALLQADAAAHRKGYWGVPEESMDLARDHAGTIADAAAARWLVGDEWRPESERATRGDAESEATLRTSDDDARDALASVDDADDSDGAARGRAKHHGRGHGKGHAKHGRKH